MSPKTFTLMFSKSARQWKTRNNKRLAKLTFDENKRPSLVPLERCCFFYFSLVLSKWLKWKLTATSGTWFSGSLSKMKIWRICQHENRLAIVLFLKASSFSHFKYFLELTLFNPQDFNIKIVKTWLLCFHQLPQLFFVFLCVASWKFSTWKLFSGVTIFRLSLMIRMKIFIFDSKCLISEWIR